MNNLTNTELIEIFKNEFIVKSNQYARLNITVSVENAMPSILSNHTLSKMKNILYIFKFNLASIFNLIYILVSPKVNLDKDVFIFSNIRLYRKEFKKIDKIKIGLYNFRYFKYIHILQSLKKLTILKTVYSACFTYKLFKKNIKSYTNSINVNSQIFIKILNISFIRYIDILLTLEAFRKNNTINYHFGGHFDIYVTILSILREKRELKYIEGNQHGLFELPRNNLTYNKFYADKYNLLFEESKEYFIKCLNSNINIILDINNNKYLSNLELFPNPNNKRIIVFAMQNDNLYIDKKILKKIIDKYTNKNNIIIAYVHPNTKKEAVNRLLSEFKNIIFERKKRHSNINIIYTRYSTIGIEYSFIGVKSIYILDKESICISFNQELVNNNLFFLENYNEI